MRAGTKPLTGAIEASEAEAFEKAAHERGDSVASWSLDEVKEAEDHHGDAFANAANDEDLARPNVVEKARKEWREDANRNRVG